MRLLVVSVAVLGYTVLGYPLAIALLGRVRPRPVAGDDLFSPTVSLVVTALDEAAGIESKLENSLALDYPSDRLEIVVAADGSRDATADLARQYAGTVVLHDPVRRGKAAALSRGAAAARGQIFVFSDANNMLDRDAIRALVRLLADQHVGCVTGRKVIDNGSGRAIDDAEGLYWRYESAIRRWEARAGSVSGVNGELLAVRREAFTALPDDCVNDDFVLAMEAAIRGWRVGYAEDAVSREPASATTTDERERRARIAAGRVRAVLHVGPRLMRRNPLLAWQVISHKVLRLFAPLAAVGLVAGSATMARRGRWARLPLALVLAFCGAAAIGRRRERRGGKSSAFYLPYYVCRMGAAMASGSLRAVMRPPAALATWRRVDRGS